MSRMIGFWLATLACAPWGCPAPRGEATMPAQSEVSAAGEAQVKRHLYVRPFSADGIEASVAAGLADKLCSELAQGGSFEVICASDMAALADHQADLIRAGGCEDAACDMDLAAKLKVERLVKGSLRKVGTQLVLSVAMVDGKNGDVLVRQTHEVPADQPEKLLEATPKIAEALAGGR